MKHMNIVQIDCQGLRLSETTTGLNVPPSLQPLEQVIIQSRRECSLRDEHHYLSGSLQVDLLSKQIDKPHPFSLNIFPIILGV